MIDAIKTTFSTAKANLEVTLEANPEVLLTQTSQFPNLKHCDHQTLIGFRNSGVNRISLGIQVISIDSEITLTRRL
jgi:coproporphyrinogen III oxidase-like Fe-S oxidoreductase